MKKFNIKLALIALIMTSAWMKQVNAQGSERLSENLTAGISSPVGLINAYVSDKLRITFNVDRTIQATISIMDLTGKTIRRIGYNIESGVSEFTYPVTDLPMGLYLVNVYTTDFALTKRFIVQ